MRELAVLQSLSLGVNNEEILAEHTGSGIAICIAGLQPVNVC
jgi:hypothetical protein